MQAWFSAASEIASFEAKPPSTSASAEPSRNAVLIVRASAATARRRSRRGRLRLPGSRRLPYRSRTARCNPADSRRRRTASPGPRDRSSKRGLLSPVHKRSWHALRARPGVVRSCGLPLRPAPARPAARSVREAPPGRSSVVVLVGQPLEGLHLLLRFRQTTVQRRFAAKRTLARRGPHPHPVLGHAADRHKPFGQRAQRRSASAAGPRPRPLETGSPPAGDSSP